MLGPKVQLWRLKSLPETAPDAAKSERELQTNRRFRFILWKHYAQQRQQVGSLTPKSK